MSIYAGASNAKKEAAQLYLGRNGTKKEVVEAYYGKSGVKQVYSAAEPGQQVFTSSGTFTVPKGVRKVDIFLVGGGSAGAFGDMRNSYGDGGGGGYTTTIKEVSVTPYSSYSIVIGAGGTAGGMYDDGYVQGTGGGTSTGLGYSASGGCISNGGSGGGQGSTNSVYYTSGNGGSDGSPGYQRYYNQGYSQSDTIKPWSSGQGTTTRAFGESSGTLYAGGGAGGGNRRGNPGDGATANGGGGNGGWSGSSAGISGIVIIRWGY